MKLSNVLAAGLVAAALTAPLAVEAHPIAAPGTEGFLVVVTSTDDVIATYQGTTAAYSDDLYLETGSFGFVFNNHTSAVGSTVNLGSYAIGTELVFRLASPEGNFLTGPGSRNPDGLAHARVQNNWLPNETLVSFEDLYNVPEGVNGYNDLSFSFLNTASVPSSVPEPMTAALLGLGLAALGFARRRRG
jgi:hypothetical protein